MKTVVTRQPDSAQADIAQRTFAFLEGRRSGVLATLDAAGGTPHAVVVYYSVTPDHRICFLTKRDTRKARNLEANGAVMFVVYDEYEQAVVQVSGTARRIEDPADVHEQFMETLRSSISASDSAVPPIAKLAAGDYTGYVIVPEEIRFSEYKHRRSDRFQVA